GRPRPQPYAPGKVTKRGMACWTFLTRGCISQPVRDLRLPADEDVRAPARYGFNLFQTLARLAAIGIVMSSSSQYPRCEAGFQLVNQLPALINRSSFTTARYW